MPIRVDDRTSATAWRQLAHAQRCSVLGRAAALFARDREPLLQTCQQYRQRSEVEWLTSEWLPLCAALEHLRRRGGRILADRRLGAKGRPTWLWGVHSVVTRQAWGKVLVVAPGNYPVYLPGVQVAQALAAGNTVMLKPAPGCEQISRAMVDRLYEAGVPTAAVTVLDSSPAAAQQAIERGVDLVVLTGSSQTGRTVLGQCVERLTPAVMELSGCDAMIVGPGARLDQVVPLIHFALTLNSGATCIGPRRIFVVAELMEPLKKLLQQTPPAACNELYPGAGPIAIQRIRQAMQLGAVDVWGRDESVLDGSDFFPMLLEGVSPTAEIATADTFAPVACLMPFEKVADLQQALAHCPYRLAASILASPTWAQAIASLLDVGTVTINDAIFPTADPRVPFPAIGESGFGVTRGDEGLLQMTRPKVVSIHRGSFYPHLRPQQAGDAQLLSAMMGLSYGNAAEKWRSLKQLMTQGLKRSQSHKVAKAERKVQ